MATVTLKNVPRELIEALKEQAARNRRSLNQEALLRLESSLGAPRASSADKVKVMRRIQRRLAGMKPLDDAFLDRAKREGRS
jgi:antitoxin FitA